MKKAVKIVISQPKFELGSASNNPEVSVPFISVKTY
jgi:hypothetical protein